MADSYIDRLYREVEHALVQSTRLEGQRKVEQRVREEAIELELVGAFSNVGCNDAIHLMKAKTKGSTSAWVTWVFNDSLNEGKNKRSPPALVLNAV